MDTGVKTGGDDFIWNGKRMNERTENPTLKSLMKHSSTHIDKIYLIKEKEQPYNEEIDWIFSYFEEIFLVLRSKDWCYICD